MNSREEFEKWKLPLLRVDNAKRYFEKLETDEYAWHHIQCEWEAWQEQQKKIDELEDYVSEIENKVEEELTIETREVFSREDIVSAIQDVCDGYFRRLECGRYYLMSTKKGEITAENALEAFGFGRQGIDD